METVPLIFILIPKLAFLGYYSKKVVHKLNEYNSVCKSCGKRFNPLNKNGEFSFNCPYCKSSLTSPSTQMEEETQ